MDLNITLPCSTTSFGPANQLFGLFIQTIIAAQCAISPPDMWPKDDGINIENIKQQQYDFIIIGAGSAGSVVANRLSENQNWSVLLLEAGGDPPMESEIPGLAYTLFKTQYDWSYYVEKSKVAALSTPLGTYWPRGKLLGGSSAINNIIYMRGNNEDYDNWERLGNPGWGWKDVLYYFRKSEDNQNPAFVGRYHGSGGPQKVDYSPYFNQLTTIFKNASAQLGYAQVIDLTSNIFVGFAYVQSTSYKGERWSAARAFLNSIKNRKNLHIVKHAHVSKINFNHDNEVKSVSFVLNETKEYTVKVKKEVILSAGTINSPQLLMLSGIGPKKHLKKHEIDVIKNLPVGYNLKDHLVVPLLFKLHKSTAVPISKEDTLNNIYQYALFRNGPLSGGVSFLGMVDSTRTNSSIPDTEIYYIGFRRQFADITKFPLFVGFDESVLNQIIANNQLYDIGVTLISLLRPESVGRIKLRSSKYNDKPKIYANYLTKQYDIETVVRVMKQQIEFAKTKVFKQNEGEVLKISIPQCDQIEYDSDKYRECYIRHMVTSIYHPAGTVKMGPENDKSAVVNPRLQVQGVKKLRVADASIMPMIVSGNLNAPCMMIGEKAADLIKEDYQ